MIASHILGIAIEYLTDGEYTRRLSVFGPKLLRHLRRCVNSNSIEAVGGYCVVDPVFESGSNEGVGLVQVWEVGQTTRLNLINNNNIIIISPVIKDTYP